MLQRNKIRENGNTLSQFRHWLELCVQILYNHDRGFVRALACKLIRVSTPSAHTVTDTALRICARPHEVICIGAQTLLTNAICNACFKRSDARRQIVESVHSGEV